MRSRPVSEHLKQHVYAAAVETSVKKMTHHVIAVKISPLGIIVVAIFWVRACTDKIVGSRLHSVARGG